MFIAGWLNLRQLRQRRLGQRRLGQPRLNMAIVRCIRGVILVTEDCAIDGRVAPK